VDTPDDIQITPKMSFGTGHHATTQLMMQTMQEMDLIGHSVLDFGTGTGVLAIPAEMMGAGEITAIDNDDWSVENAKENCERNQCRNIKVGLGSLEDLPMAVVDDILANINRHISSQYMPGHLKIENRWKAINERFIG
jgi:ribosomal protein L11 methyltransferase